MPGIRVALFWTSGSLPAAWLIGQRYCNLDVRSVDLQVAEPEGYGDKKQKRKRKGEAPKFAVDSGMAERGGAGGTDATHAITCWMVVLTNTCLYCLIFVHFPV